jgi:CPA1 family monovalent cation:H+ antiporter
VPAPEHGRGALGTRRKPPGKWRSRIDRRTLSWQENVVVSWTGMRGVVTLAAAAAIPVTTMDGEPFPERATIQAIAFVVSVGTLLIQGWSLPWLIRRLRLSRFNDDHAADREEELKAERVVHSAADEVLTEFRANPPADMDPRMLAEIRAAVARHSEDVDEMPDPEAPTKRAKVFSALYRDVLAAQRAALIAERDEGRIEDEAVRAMLERLDLQEAGVSSRLESRL